MHPHLNARASTPCASQNVVLGTWTPPNPGASRPSLHALQNFVLCPRTVTLRIPEFHSGSPDPRPRTRRSQAQKCSSLSLLFSIPKAVSQVVPSLEDGLLPTTVWERGPHCLLAQNEWKPLRRQAGLNLRVQDARVRCQCLTHPPPKRVPTPTPPTSGFFTSFSNRGRAFRGGVWAELAPRKGRGPLLPTSQGGARRERAACPGSSRRGAD